MQRIESIQRPDFAEKLESIGLSFHSWDNYWKEDVCYKFTAEQIDEIELATENLHKMCLDAVEYVVSNRLFHKLGIPEKFHDEITESWNQRDPSLYGRFDLAYDGINPPKMLEYNADTPTSLLESAVAQWAWLEDVNPKEDQFNSLHDKLIERWKIVDSNVIHVATLKDNEEDWVCGMYLVDTIIQAGKRAIHIDVEDIGWDSTQEAFVDMSGNPINCLFKLYPWEWMMVEEFGDHVINCKTQFIEPIWKSILSCKGILPILWELYPNHKNLLPAFFDVDPSLGEDYAKKPLFSREGANVTLVKNGDVVSSSTGVYGEDGYIYQMLFNMPNCGGRYPVIGSWVVGNDPAGMCIREDSGMITTNQSNFVPHYFI